MADDPFYAPNGPPWQAQPSERLFEVLSGPDRFLCELRDRGVFGVEAQFFLNEKLFIRRRFDTRERAMQWAEEVRKAIERFGA